MEDKKKISEGDKKKIVVFSIFRIYECKLKKDEEKQGEAVVIERCTA